MDTKDVGEGMETLVRELHRFGVVYGESVMEFKKRFITYVLRVNGGNQIMAAREMGMHRNTLARHIVELKIDVAEAKSKPRPYQRPERKDVSNEPVAKVERLMEMSARAGA
jgi:Fis family transcriptional regulator, factor for inversion stimulation protein